ncbi:hypothetical protein U1872_08135 [Sphingomonas sp. RB3P16]|uniref:hypothetical protein n=1 Tax=Parasphingomonas frigoris TaxID=3096163 RepID=UPI002FC68BA7
MTVAHACNRTQGNAEAAKARLACSAPWRDLLQREQGRRRRSNLRQAGNIVYLPAPIAAYRLRHTARHTIVEIVSRGGHITHIDRSATAAAARQLLSMIWADHSRPVLPEVVDGVMFGGGS